MHLAILLALEPPAHALDLDSLVLAWTNTVDGLHGTDGNDEARGVAIDADENIVAVGWRDGDVDHGTDGYIATWNPDGTLAWDFVEDVGAVGADRTTSSDKLASIDFDPATGDFAVCGQRGTEVVANAEGRYLVERYAAPVASADPVLDWEFEYTYGVSATSPIQECFDVAWSLGLVHSAGWGVHDQDQGAWISWKLAEDDAIASVPLFFDDQAYLAVPDQAYGLAVDEVSANVAIVGVRGISGLDGSVLNDADWYVRYYDPTGLLLWEHTLGGANFLDDRALDVAIEVLTQDVYVAGWMNAGTDNAGNANYDWVVVRYDDDGDGLGGPLVVWTQTWEGFEGASEGATAITIDELGDPIVGGWAIDAATGQEVWRLAKLTSYDGSPAQAWQGVAHGGNSRLAAIAYDGNKVAMSGYVDVGAGRDFAAAVIEPDGDGDGTGDSVDACPDDEEKAADTGICGCNIPDIDTDGDGTANCVEDCPTDPEKTEPGICGCETPDTDTDGDGTPDCTDNCETDPLKVDFGECGCNAPDTDTDGDGVLGCNDACANTPPDTEVDGFGCPIPEVPDDTGVPGGDGGSGGGGCGCDGAGGALPASLASLALLAAASLVRRKHEPSERSGLSRH